MKNFNNDAVVPFLWVRDEDEKIIEKEIDAIKALSINAFMIESRPRVLSESDFGEQSWYTRVGKILAYARKLNMQVWLLDDRSFPTGSANGKMNSKYPHLRAKQLKCVAIDVTLNGNQSLVLTGVKNQDSDKIVYAFMSGENQEIELNVKGDERIIALPQLKGLFRVYFLIQTEDCPERDGYIDMINPESTEILIKEVYEPHYNHFKDYFGSTFMGYFSDEPRFCNGINWHYSTPLSMYDYNLGKINAGYPISKAVLDKLQDKGYSKKDLISLFIDYDAKTKDIRADYMDIITDEYSKNFVGKLSNWCKQRNVSYSGHVIEDMGVHLTSGCGAGHYFKAMKGADYAAIDVVLHQIKPYYNAKKSLSPVEGGVVDGRFFNYTLAKLASSCAVQSDTAKGKSFCEIFGAYGWGESLDDMLYLVNHIAVRGINHFIPHAFSMDLYDKDCPPYFFGQGKNPSYNGYKKLFDYMNFLSNFSYNSYARVAVLYNADSVWCGDEYLSIDKVAESLFENQIEFDFIDVENIKKAKCVDEKLILNGCEYDTLVIPNGYLRKQTKEILSSIKIKTLIVTKENVNDFVEALNGDYRLKKHCKGLRVKKIDKQSYMLFNESLDAVENALVADEQLYLVNPLNKTILGASKGGELKFTLMPGQALFAFDSAQGYEPEANLKPIDEILEFEVRVKPFNKDDYQNLGVKNVDFNVCLDNLDFSGSVNYKFEYDCKNDQYLVVEYYGEFINVQVNGKSNDYIERKVVTKLDKGKNEISLTICNTLANAMKDALSMYSNISSCGIKSVKICVKE